MATNARKKRKTRRQTQNQHGYDKVALKPRNDKQRLALEAIDDNSATFLRGVPGCCKTLLSVYKAIEYLDNRYIDNIYVTKANVKNAGEDGWGALPGTIEEKSDIHLEPIYDSLRVFVSPGRIEYIRSKRIFEFLPLSYLRGRTLRNCFLIVEEAQNMTAHAVYTVLSRIGEDSKVVFTGDEAQRDLRAKFGKSGLEDAISRIQHLEDVGVIEFGFDDIQRSDFAKRIIMSYSDLY